MATLVVGLEGVRSLMRRYLEQDSGRQSIEVEGSSVEDALRNAGIQLSLPLSRLEYVVLEEGHPGIAGIGRKSWKIRVNEVAGKEDASAFAPTEDEFAELSPQELVKDVDGEALVRLLSDGAYLKVTAPSGKGRRATERNAFERLQARSVRDVKEDLVARVVKDASEDWVRVGTFIANPAADALVSCELTDAEMKGYITVMPPGAGGCDLTTDAIRSILRSSRIISGYLEDVLQDFEDHPVYKTPLLVAEGEKPVNGHDAAIQYFFEVDKSKARLKESSTGRVDFKELNLIQNVVANQPLGKKIPAEKAKHGKTVTGKIITAKDGRDIPLPLGKNVRLDDNGSTIISTINGQVVMSNGRINVEEVYTISGDVSLRTGNVMFLGTVIVNGNVEDGFSVKASGNIEIYGNVGKAELDAEGDIIVHQGIAAKNSGHIHAGKSIWARFIENAVVEAGENVIVSDGIINSVVDANRKIVCQGKRAAIVGGHLRAAEEVNAKVLGSAVSGTETILEVGFDPKSKEKQEGLIGQADQLRRQIDELEKNILTLEALKKQKKVLPEDKEAILQEQSGRKADLEREHQEIQNEISSISNYLNALKVKGKVSAYGKIYPGVRITIRDQSYEVKNEQKGVTFFLEGSLIRTTRYEAVEDVDVRKGPPDAR